MPKVNDNLLITGASGMLGSSFKMSFQELGVKLLTPSRAELDLRDRLATHDYFKKNRVSEVIHCAARVGGISENIKYPLDFILENLLIDSSVIEASVKTDVEKFLYIGSSCMYPAGLNDALLEGQLLSGKLEETNKGYALAKLSGSQAVISAAFQNKVPWKVVIPSNLYGPGDCIDLGGGHLIAAIILKLLTAQKTGISEVEIWGDGKAKREFTFVHDVTSFVANNWSRMSAWPDFMNIGVGQDLTVTEYYELVAKITGYTGTFRFDLEKPTGMRRKLVNSSLARDFGWNPQTSHFEGITATVAWYKSALGANE